MRRRLQLAAVFSIAWIVLSLNLWNTGIASGWIDPVLHLGAQDEAVYTHQAIGMLMGDGWLTPKLGGRLWLEKPPLLVWLSAASMKLFGIGPFAARAPAVFAGALIVAICFAVVRDRRTALAGLAAALLCVASPLLFTMSRHNMTDILVAAAAVTAFAVQSRDASLTRRGSRILFTLALAAGILTKSIAGLLPAFAAFAFACVSKDARAARLRRAMASTASAIVLASPWFLYQLTVHREWLLADMGFQILTVGLEPHQTSPENHVAFYLVRLLYTAPVTLVLCITGIPAMAAALRRRDDIPLLLACYLAVLAAALLVFRFHSEQYLTPVLPFLILVAAISSPLLAKPLGAPAIAALAAIFIVKAANPQKPWGLSYRGGSTIAAAGALSDYCEQRRGNELYVMDVPEEFYALALPLARVRYGWTDPQGVVARIRPHLIYLGVVQGVRPSADSGTYAARLRAWGLDSTEPLGAGIVVRHADELAAFVLSRPESDFLVSREIARKLAGRQTHDITLTTPDYVFLQSRTPLPGGTPRWTCRM